MAWRFQQKGQFAYELWEPFLTPDYVRVILVDGLLETVKMAFFSVIFAVVFGTVFGVGNSPTTRRCGGCAGPWWSSSGQFRCC